MYNIMYNVCVHVSRTTLVSKGLTSQGVILLNGRVMIDSEGVSSSIKYTNFTKFQFFWNNRGYNSLVATGFSLVYKASIPYFLVIRCILLISAYSLISTCYFAGLTARY